MRVNSGSPCLVDERCRCQVLSVRSIQQEVKPVTAGLREQFPFLALEFGVEQDWRLHRIPVVHVMRRGLEMPRQLPGVRVQRHYRARIKVIARAPFAR